LPSPEMLQSLVVPGLWASNAAFVTGCAMLAMLLIRAMREAKQANARIAELEACLAPVDAIASLTAEENRKLDAARAEVDVATRSLGEIRADYASKRAIFDRLTHETKALEDRLDLAELGLYEPKFRFESSAQYERALTRNREDQKSAIASGRAVYCTTNWVVEGSKRAGDALARRAIRMTLRAFNNECEVLIGKASWKNHDRIAGQIEKSFAAINALNESNKTVISDDFLAMKLDELELTYEEHLKKKEEADELREERVRAREEAKAQREIEAQIRKTEEEEIRRKEALNAARAELGQATEAERRKLNEEIAALQAKLDEATAEHDRAISMAEQTRVGYVYAISNVGSFGESVFKIGMTRRVDPDDRVDELGDASVPFEFDVHAMAFTRDAPKLERDLHLALDEFRLNRVNLRKEFFRVPLSILRAKFASLAPEATFVDVAEAGDYYLSLPVEAKREIAARIESDSAFPSAL
jgi:hypothetical protein